MVSKEIIFFWDLRMGKQIGCFEFFVLIVNKQGKYSRERKIHSWLLFIINNLMLTAIHGKEFRHEIWCTHSFTFHLETIVCQPDLDTSYYTYNMLFILRTLATENLFGSRHKLFKSKFDYSSNLHKYNYSDTVKALSGPLRGKLLCWGSFLGNLDTVDSLYISISSIEQSKIMYPK